MDNQIKIFTRNANAWVNHHLVISVAKGGWAEEEEEAGAVHEGASSRFEGPRIRRELLSVLLYFENLQPRRAQQLENSKLRGDCGRRGVKEERAVNEQLSRANSIQQCVNRLLLYSPRPSSSSIVFRYPHRAGVVLVQRITVASQTSSSRAA